MGKSPLGHGAMPNWHRWLHPRRHGRGHPAPSSPGGRGAVRVDQCRGPAAGGWGNRPSPAPWPSWNAWWGAELASRGRSGLVLTAAGRRLLPEAPPAVAAFDAALTCLDGPEGVALLGFSWLLPSWLAGELDGALRAGDPAFRLRLQRTEQPVADVLAGVLHGCLVREPSSREGLAVTPIATEERMLAIAHDSAHQAAIGAAWAALGSQPLVVNRATGTTQASLWTPVARVTAICSNFDEWQACVAADRGIGWCRPRRRSRRRTPASSTTTSPMPRPSPSRSSTVVRTFAPPPWPWLLGPWPCQKDLGHGDGQDTSAGERRVIRQQGTTGRFTAGPPTGRCSRIMCPK